MNFDISIANNCIKEIESFLNKTTNAYVIEKLTTNYKIINDFIKLYEKSKIAPIAPPTPRAPSPPKVAVSPTPIVSPTASPPIPIAPPTPLAPRAAAASPPIAPRAAAASPPIAAAASPPIAPRAAAAAAAAASPQRAAVSPPIAPRAVSPTASPQKVAASPYASPPRAAVSPPRAAVSPPRAAVSPPRAAVSPPVSSITCTTPSTKVIDIMCKIQGTFGCFMNFQDLRSVIKNCSAFNIEGYNPSKSTYINLTDKENILTQLEGKSFKIMKDIKYSKTGQGDGSIIEEENAFKSLAIIGDEFIEKFTTYNNITSNFVKYSILKFKSIQNYNFNITGIHNIKSNNNILSTITIILFSGCSTISIDNFDPIKLIKDISEPLKILHSKNYTHMDIKQDNIVLCKDKYKLIDFGMLKDRTYLTSVGGTDGYILPALDPHQKGVFRELFNISLKKITQLNKSDMNHYFKKSDEYAVACILYLYCFKKYNLYKFNIASDNNIYFYRNNKEFPSVIREIENYLNLLLKPELYFQNLNI